MIFVNLVGGKYHCEYICPRSAKFEGSGRGFSLPPYSSLDCGKFSGEVLGVEWKFPAAVVEEQANSMPRNADLYAYAMTAVLI